MKSVFAASAVTLLAFATPSFAQTTSGAAGTSTGTAGAGSTGTSGAGTSTSDMPESMRIEQQTTEQYNRTSGTSAQGATTTEAPGGASGQVEHNRIDPAAPSDKRLQIDDGASAAVRQNPDANVNTLHPSSSGTSYNTIVRGSPSTGGTGATGSSTGVSGSSSSIGSGSMGSGSSHGSSSGSSAGSSSH